MRLDDHAAVNRAMPLPLLPIRAQLVGRGHAALERLHARLGRNLQRLGHMHQELALVLALGSGSIYIAQSAFWTLSADIGRGSAGSLSGFMNFGCQIGGASVAQITPIVAERFGWTTSFLIPSVACIIGAVCWLLIDPNAELHGKGTKLAAAGAVGA